MATRKKSVQKRTSRAKNGGTPPGVDRVPGGLVVRPSPPPPAPAREWVEGPVAVSMLWHAVNEKRGRDALAEVQGARVAVQRLETRAVRLARAEGASWADIGAVFGVSKQAAHMRFGDLARAGRTPERDASERDQQARARRRAAAASDDAP